MNRYTPDHFPPGHPAREQIERALKGGAGPALEIVSRETSRRRPEQDLQIACVSLADQLPIPIDPITRHLWPEWLRSARLGEFLYHIPNGGARTKAEGGIFKAMGVRAGVHDLFVQLPVFSVEAMASILGAFSEKQMDTTLAALRAIGRASWYAGLYIEMKAPGGRASDSQIAFAARARRVGYACAQADSVEAFRDVLAGYFRGMAPATTEHTDESDR